MARRLTQRRLAVGWPLLSAAGGRFVLSLGIRYDLGSGAPAKIPGFKPSAGLLCGGATSVLGVSGSVSPFNTKESQKKKEFMIWWDICT